MGQRYLPLSFKANVALADFAAPGWGKVMADLTYAINSNALLLIEGGAKMGKTRLITALSHYLECPVSVALQQLPVNPSAAWLQNNTQWLNTWQQVPTLLLDDVHVMSSSQFWQAKLVHTLNMRLQNNLLTVLSTLPQQPFTLADLASRLQQAARVQFPPCLTAADKKWHIGRFLQQQQVFAGDEQALAQATDWLNLHAPGEVAALFAWLEQLQTVALAQPIRPNKTHFKQVMDKFISDKEHGLQNKT